MTRPYPSLGVGLGFREPLKTEIFLHRHSIDFLEITADHFFNSSPAMARVLEALRDDFTLVPHCLRLSLGSADGIDLSYLDQIAGLVSMLKPPWWSEHISFSSAAGIDIGHLTPMPLTAEALRVLERNIAEAQKRVPAPLILENITQAFLWPGAEMTEPEFLTQLVEITGCGLLLDATNLYTNALNHGINLEAYLEAFPWHAVVQLHFAGGRSAGDYLVDSHSGPTPPEVFELMRQICARAEVKAMSLERDHDLPPFPELERELETAREIFTRGLSCRSIASRAP